MASSRIDKRGRLHRPRIPQRLYLITTATLWPTKIGFAENIATRLSALQIGCWIELGVYANLVCADAVVFEREVHHELRDRRLAGEWFDIRADEAMKIVLTLFQRRVPGALPFVSRYRRPTTVSGLAVPLPLLDREVA